MPEKNREGVLLGLVFDAKEGGMGHRSRGKRSMAGRPVAGTAGAGEESKPLRKGDTSRLNPFQGCSSPQAAESPGQGHLGWAGLVPRQLLGRPALRHFPNTQSP